jgi:hypothetical protein
MGLLTLLPILALAFFIERRFRLPSPVALLHVIAWLIVALYVGGLVGTLWWTALGIHVLGVGALGYELLQWSKAPARIAVPFPYLLLIALSGVFWLVHGHDEYVFYDEYAHWGIFLKDMLAFDDFWRADTNAMHARYLPGSTLWQYLFNAFQEPTEGKAYLAQFVLLIAPLMVLWNRLSWRQLPWTLGILALCVLVLMNFGLGVSSLYVDSVIGAWFVGTLLCYVSDTGLSWQRTAPYAASLIVLTLLKDAGLAFALAVAGIIAALTLRRAWTQHQNARMSLIGAVTALVLLATPSFVTAAAWSWNRDRAGVVEDVKSIDSLFAGFTRGTAGRDTATELEVGRRFEEVFFHQQISNDATSQQFNEFSYQVRERFTDRYRLSTFGLFVTFIAWWVALLAAFVRGAGRWTWGILAAGTLVTAVSYVGLLYLSYRFAFGDRSLELPSYTRYIHSIALPMVVLALAPFLPAFRTPGQEPVVRLRSVSISAGAVLFTGVLITLYTFERPYLQPLLQPNPQFAVRQDFEPLAANVRGAVGNARVWVYIPTDRDELIGRVLQFLVSPTRASVERSETFLDQGFDAVVRRWSEFEYVWIPISLKPETAESLSAFVPGHPAAGLFRVRGDATPGHALEPLASDAGTRNQGAATR